MALALAGLVGTRTGEEQLDGRAMPQLGIDLHRAAGLLHEAIHHAQAEATALADTLGGEERFERAGDDLRLMPVPVSVTAIIT